MKTNLAFGAFLVVVILALVGLGTLVFASHFETSPSLSGCTEHATGDIGLTVVDSSMSKGVAGLTVRVDDSMPECESYGTAAETNTTVLTTDSNGTIMTYGLGNFVFNVMYNGSEYNVTGEAIPMALTCLTLYVPTGQIVNRSATMSSTANNC